MSRRSTTRYAVGLTAGAALALAGCSGTTPTPGTTSAGSTSATTVASRSSTATIATAPPTNSSPSSAGPVIPAEAQVQSPAGAVAFTKHFFGLVNQAWTKPEAGLMAPHFTPACLTCQNFENNAKEYVTANTHYDKTPLEILEVSTHGPATPGSLQQIDVAFHQVRAKVVDQLGKSVEEIREGRGVFVVDVAWSSSQWKLTSIKLLQ